ncbi:MAG: hypothetical protein A2Z88_07775 [Omnitrophica WOR_2 bacterium GWA2_47_8]|nr:MAG: hypothetical protein A2Z88_07775 [Omnitrophica WOR_2 bacterium GWA2_47_8]
MNFPKNFLWGAVTSSHQVEGNNINNDWWAWEQAGKTKERSQEAARHFELYKNDLQSAKELNHNAHRFSIEWSRIEPKEGKFDEKAVAHYRDVILSLREKNIEPVVTLHHFTNPKWVYERGGWLNPKISFWFSRYAVLMAEALGKDVQYWITINEPMVFAYQSYFLGIWPPGQKSIKNAWKVVHHLIKAHRIAYREIHKVYQNKQWPLPKVSIAKNVMVFRACPKTDNAFCRLGVFLRHQLFNLYFLKKIKPCLDFIGVNFYARDFISNDKKLNAPLLGMRCNESHGHVERVNALAWDCCPECLFEVLCWLKGFQKDILITENGTCDDDDRLRFDYVDRHLKEIQRAIEIGIPIIGYLYWSLLDNFEWHHGFGPRFGLIEVNYKDFSRRPRKSAVLLSKIYQDPTLIGKIKY